MNKLAILKMSKKKIIAAICAICLFAGGAIIGAQITASAANNAVAVLPAAKGGTGQNNLAAVLGVGSALTANNADVFKTARTINNVSFNGSANITLPIYGAYGAYSTDRTYFKASTAIPSGTRLIFNGVYQCNLAGASAVQVNRTGGTTWSGTTLNASMAYKGAEVLNYNIDLTVTSNLAAGSILFTLYGTSVGVPPLSNATVYAIAATRG
jgi:hypothetical protein